MLVWLLVMLMLGGGSQGRALGTEGGQEGGEEVGALRRHGGGIQSWRWVVSDRWC